MRECFGAMRRPWKFRSSKLSEKPRWLADEAEIVALLDIDMPDDAPSGSEIAQPRPHRISLVKTPKGGL